MNGENYLEILHEVVVPQLQTKPNFDELFFQQDGAPPHYALRIRDYLNEVFPQHWFGRRGSNPKTVNELKDYIHDAFREIDEN